MKVIEENKNALLKRTEVVVHMTHSGTPKSSDAAKHLAEHYKSDEGCVAVKSISNRYGSNDFVIDAFIYSSPEAKQSFEPKIKEKKKVAG